MWCNTLALVGKVSTNANRQVLVVRSCDNLYRKFKAWHELQLCGSLYDCAVPCNASSL
jgi:hypothetical protein